MTQGAHATHQALVNELSNYIQSQYFGRNPALYEAVRELMVREGMIYRVPYIESSPAYCTAPGGIESSQVLAPWLKEFFERMCKAGLGVFSEPYVHQVQSLEHFYQGHDLFVSTGTGSGKTECFLWPLLARMAMEAHDSPESWQQRAVRCIVLYPMNALVSDQLSRMRRLMGCKGDFPSIFKSLGSYIRRPQFGMYTGRTPYPGRPSKTEDKRLARTYMDITGNDDIEWVKRLEQEGRLPARVDLNLLITQLLDGIHKASIDDAELVTRFEMHMTAPDILITNYSMIEYMMLRPAEAPIWSSTAKWLSLNPDQKLLFVLDEAHMYKGSSGGEVAMLLRRVMNSLKIDRSRIQFILTTASMPEGEEDDLIVQKFARNLTGAPEGHDFVLLRGERQQLSQDNLLELDDDAVASTHPADFEGSRQQQLQALITFWERQPVRDAEPDKWDMEQAENWMYEHLFEYDQFNALARQCRGNATSLKELAQRLYPELYEHDQEAALHRISVLLAIAPLARSRQGSVLLPARMHMFFRGIQGVWCCTNSQCPGRHDAAATSSTAAGDGSSAGSGAAGGQGRAARGLRGLRGMARAPGKGMTEPAHASATEPASERLPFGRLFINDRQSHCPDCGSSVHELMRDRRCGALFFRGYVYTSELEKGMCGSGSTYLWKHPGNINPDRLSEICLYLAQPDEVPDNNQQVWLDSSSGWLYFDDSCTGAGMVRLFFNKNAVNSISRTSSKVVACQPVHFSTCPHCQHRIGNDGLMSFSTRGNNSFFNLIKAQFLSQPPVPGKTVSEQQRRLTLAQERAYGQIPMPNEGRKVLLFSDSRQRAARLARDMSVTSDDTACRQIMCVALDLMEQIERRKVQSGAADGTGSDAGAGGGADGQSLLSLYNVFPYFAAIARLNNAAIFHDDSSENRTILFNAGNRMISSALAHKKSRRSGNSGLGSLLRRSSQAAAGGSDGSSCASGAGDDSANDVIDYDLISSVDARYVNNVQMHNAPNSFNEQLLKFFCAPFNNLIDTAMCWLEPDPQALYRLIDDLDEQSVEELATLIAEQTGKTGVDQLTEEDVQQWLHEFFSAWAIESLTDYYALSAEISDETRARASPDYVKFGIPEEKIISERLLSRIEIDPLGNLAGSLAAGLKNYFLESGSESTGRLYINPRMIRARSGDHQWYVCNSCSDVLPFKLRNCCPNCGRDRVRAMTDLDLESLSFWRRPSLEAISGRRIHVIDTQEHTAQLSHKDQRDDMWSRTEMYEMRFQDFLSKDELPVDILSSTTTMEVGIDIGSLVAVGLRNMPPMRENYQQRAGRAGRRGSSLSTIVTFCEDGPHDSLYFNHPADMVRGIPRRPFIDISSSRIIERHLSLVIFRDFLAQINSTMSNADKKELHVHYSDRERLDPQRRIDLSLDTVIATEFVERLRLDFMAFARSWQADEVLLPEDNQGLLDSCIMRMDQKLTELGRKMKAHPDLYYNPEAGGRSSCRSLLDVLYDESLIPTYSFPRDVVSTWIGTRSGRVLHEVSRGLDVAISEYAPGRSIVVDKETWPLGAIYRPTRKSNLAPASSYFSDGFYLKEIHTCGQCRWFGLADDSQDRCPFCGSLELKRSSRPMLRPWGFAPRTGGPVTTMRDHEQYSAASEPQYSTQPEADDMKKLDECRHIKMAVRDNQRIIMVNRGPDGRGFKVCRNCGVAMPGAEKIEKKRINSPVTGSNGRPAFCRHEFADVDLGFDFITDMLVLELSFDPDIVDTEHWLKRAGQTMAEALRLAACHELDIEFTELVTGIRRRRDLNSRTEILDIFLYDSLSSGAGYAVSLQDRIMSMISFVRDLLSGCQCQSACYDCIKHYYNRFVHSLLDRRAALDLIDYCVYNRLPQPLSTKEQSRLLTPLTGIINDAGAMLIPQALTVTGVDCNKRSIMVYPAMYRSEWAINNLDHADIMISAQDLQYSLPDAFRKLIHITDAR